MADEAQNAMLQKIAAAAVPHMLGLVYSRYGQPAPTLGRDRMGGPSEAGRSPAALGASGRPGSSQQDAGLDEAVDRMKAEEDARLQKYAELPDPEDQAAAEAEQNDLASNQRGTLVDAYPDTEGLEDLMDNEPNLTVRDVQHFAQDHARGGIGWEDWLGQYQDEKASGDPRAGTRP